VRLSFIYGFGSGHGVFIATSVPRGALGGWHLWKISTIVIFFSSLKRSELCWNVGKCAWFVSQMSISEDIPLLVLPRGALGSWHLWKISTIVIFLLRSNDRTFAETSTSVLGLSNICVFPKIFHF
jgi:hypothetical protein